MLTNRLIIQIKAAVAAVRNIRGLPSTQDLEKTGSFMDLFEFLGVVFGFQVFSLNYSYLCIFFPFCLLSKVCYRFTNKIGVGKLDKCDIMLFLLTLT